MYEGYHLIFKNVLLYYYNILKKSVFILLTYIGFENTFIRKYPRCSVTRINFRTINNILRTGTYTTGLVTRINFRPIDNVHKTGTNTTGLQ